MCWSRVLLGLHALLVALVFAACYSSEEVPDGQRAIRCGSAENAIDTRQLLDLPEQESVELGRQHGCLVRAEMRDGTVVAPAPRGRPFRAIGVATPAGYVTSICPGNLR